MAKASVKEKAVLTALDLAAEKGWQNVSLADIAAAGKIDISVLREYFDDRFDILAALGRMIDKKVLDDIDVNDESLSPRDKLFDIMMARFDVLNDHRAGLCAILNSFKTDPKQAVISLPHLGRSMSWMLEAAGMNTCGLQGAVKLAGLSALYLKTLRVWMDDDSPDMAKTMAALDKSLGKAEEWAGRFGL